MKEIKSIVNSYQKIDFSKSRAALATVVRIEGSSYRRTGARMLVLDDGNYGGGISGGCLEGDALRRAQKAIASNKPSVVTYDTLQDDAYQIGVGLGCQGIIDVMFTPLDPTDKQNPVSVLIPLQNTRVPRVLVTIDDTKEKPELLGRSWPYENDEQFQRQFPFPNLVPELIKDIHEALAEEKSKTGIYSMGMESLGAFIEIIKPATHLMLYGSNPDIFPLARIASELGWDITVVMPMAKANKSLHDLVTRIVDNKSDSLHLVDPYTAVVLMAHDYKTDLKNLREVILTDARYIGLLGPNKRGRKMLDTLAGEGKSGAEIREDRIFTPAGLDIGADTPEEIALSILAEIQSHFKSREGRSLRLREGTIHEH